jgi:hypothetical protein
MKFHQRISSFTVPYGEISLKNKSSTRSRTHWTTGPAGSRGTRRPPEGEQRVFKASDVMAGTEAIGVRPLRGGAGRTVSSDEDVAGNGDKVE